MVTTNEMMVGVALMPDNVTPLNYDPLPNTKFKLIFNKIPNTIFFLQGFNLPGVSVREVRVPTNIVDMNEIGEKMVFEPFTINFLIDTEFRAYHDIYAWMKRMTVLGTNVGETDTVDFLINDNKTIRFYDAWPMSLSNLSFETNVNDVIYVTCSATINYDYFDFV